MIEDVVNVIRKNFRANGCPAQVEIGPQFVAENAAPPRVVFVPVTSGDTYEPPLAVQPRYGADPETEPYQNPRSLATCWAAVEAHIWACGVAQVDAQLQYAADRAALGALRNQTYQSLYYAAGMSFFRNVSGGELTKPGLVMMGIVYVMRFQIAIPVLEIPWVQQPPFGKDAAAKTGNTWTNLPGVKPKITEEFQPTGVPQVIIQP